MSSAAVEAEVIAVAPKSLAQKIAEIQNTVGVVQKKGKYGSEGGAGGHWNYLRIEDAVVAVNKLMSQRDLILTGTLQKKPNGEFYHDRIPHTTKGYIVSVVMQWTLEDVSSGESRSWDFPGEGYDGTDKATYKAETGSRKYAIVNIFNLPVGNDVEERGAPTFEEGKEKQKRVVASKIADAAGRGNQTALDVLAQVEPERKVIISRPEEFNGHYIAVEGYIAVPPMERFFDDTGSKRFKRRSDNVPYWKVPSEYERGVIDLCGKLGIEVE